MSKKKRTAKPRASVAEAAERARVRKVLDKRDAKGLASLKPGEIALLRRHEQQERDRYMAESLANVSQKTLVQLLDTDRFSPGRQNAAADNGKEFAYVARP